MKGRETERLDYVTLHRISQQDPALADYLVGRRVRGVPTLGVMPEWD